MFVRLVILLAMGISACSKMAEVTNDNNNSSNSQLAETGKLSYGDTLLFYHQLTSDKFAPVLSKPAGAAIFKAIPGGLSIDSLTGQINISKSESGLRYKVFAVNKQGLAIDSVKLVISGVDYADGIYNLDATPVTYDTAFPIYNARPELSLPCPDDDDDVEENQRCVFDETDLNADGNDDIPGVIQEKLLVNPKTGTIDLEASYRAGLFGSGTPANGTRKDLLMYYRLADASGRALQKIQLQVYYFRTNADIPQSLLTELSNRRNQSTQVNGRLTYTTEFSSYEKPKRPPILIIVGS